MMLKSRMCAPSRQSRPENVAVRPERIGIRQKQSAGNWLPVLVCAVLSGLLVGCGDAASSDASGGGETTASTDGGNSGVPVSTASVSKSSPVTASISSSVSNSDGAEKTGTEKLPGASAKVQFPDDDATRTLAEIQKLRNGPVPTDVEKAKLARRERNLQIVDLATNVLRLTMNDESRRPQFHQAIGQLLEARFQLALAGTEDDVNLLYADVQALNERDPKSIAAAEGVYYIAKFAHTKAGLLGRKDPVWFETLSRWAREFAARFPEQQQRAANLLFGAARTCELNSAALDDAALSARLMTESKLCYSALAESFQKTEQGQEAVSSLRRLALPGKVLSQFSGPTIDGGMISADDFPGKFTVVYFWESEDDQFAKSVLPVLQKLRNDIPSDRLRMVGVALDEDEGILNAFMEDHAVPGQQIYFPNAEQRSWNSPLIRFWGLAECPSVWLIDVEGRVISTSCRIDNLASELARAMRK